MIDDPAAVCHGARLRRLVGELQEHFVGASALTEVAREEFENYLADATDGVRIGGPRYTTDVLATTEASDQKRQEAISRAFDAMGELDGTPSLSESEVARLRGVLAEARTPGWLTPVSVKSSKDDVLDSTASTATIKFCSIARCARGETVPTRRTPASARAVAERIFACLNHSWRLERSVLEQSHREKERARIADDLRVVFFRLMNAGREWRFDIYEWDLGAEVDVHGYDWSWSKTASAARVIGSQDGQPVWIIDLKSNRLLLRVSFADPHISTAPVFEPHSFLARLANTQASSDSHAYDKNLYEVASLFSSVGNTVERARCELDAALDNEPSHAAMCDINDIERDHVHALLVAHELMDETFQASHEKFLIERYSAYQASDSLAAAVDSSAAENPLWRSLRDHIEEQVEYSIVEIQEICQEARGTLAAAEQELQKTGRFRS